MQRTLHNVGRSAPCTAPRHSRRVQPFTPARGRPCCSTTNGNGNGHHAAAAATYPTPAQTIRTIVDISSEGTLCSVSASGQPVGIPVSFSVDKHGAVQVQLDATALNIANLRGSPSCSLMVQPTSLPARAVASATLVGKVDVSAAAAAVATVELPMTLEKCLYFGMLDQTHRGQEVSAQDYQTAEPDVLRKAAPELVTSWNIDRAEDVYRIVSDFLGVPLTEMTYAELLWVDHLGMYIRAEVTGNEPTVVRVPFYRPVLDERDARSVITMAAQIAWERERSYTPPVPSIFADAAANN